MFYLRQNVIGIVQGMVKFHGYAVLKVFGPSA